jgi:hypothetical protein
MRTKSCKDLEEDGRSGGVGVAVDSEQESLLLEGLWVIDKETETVVPAMNWASLYTTTRSWSCDLITKTLPKGETIKGPQKEGMSHGNPKRMTCDYNMDKTYESSGLWMSHVITIKNDPECDGI